MNISTEEGVLSADQNKEINQMSDDEQEYWDETDPVRALHYFSKLILINIYNRISFKNKKHSHFCSSSIRTPMQCLNPMSN
jgi:hypothetical protein